MMLHPRQPEKKSLQPVFWQKRWQHEEANNKSYSSFECFTSERTQRTPTCLFYNVCLHEQHGLLFFSDKIAAIMELPPLRISPRLEHPAPEIVPFVLRQEFPSLIQPFLPLGLVLAPPDWNYVR